MSNEAQIHQGEQSTLLICDDAFRSQWQALYHRCPWATVFQSLDYLGTWYQVYHSIYEPLLVVRSSSCNGLTGLLPLAVRRSSRSLNIAGKPHAEYYGWLATPEDSDAFILATLNCLQREFPRSRLDFRFLPPNTPVGWVSSSRKWGRLCELISYPRPLMAIGDGSRIQESLRNKSNKKHLKYFERLGNLEFLHVHTFQDIQSNFQELMDFCDFRQGAVYGKLPFRSDPYKKILFTSLFGVPDLLHATVWRSDGNLISAHIGFHNQDQVILGLILHSPMLAEHSPGRLHILFLGQLLARQQIAELDLTPEGVYKDRFATRYDQVSRLTVYFSSINLRVKRIADLTLEVLRRPLGMVSVSPQRAKGFLARCQHQFRIFKKTRRPVRAIITALGKVRSTRRRLILRFDSMYAVNCTPASFSFSCDDLNALLTYQPLEPGDLPLADFLSQALRRFERGDHVYTYVKDGFLVHHVWLREIRGAPEQLEDASKGQLPVGSVVFDEFHSHIDFRHPDSLGAFITNLCMCVALLKENSHIYAVIRWEDAAFREALERSGFQCV